jgi:hypothetical protein
MLTASVIDRTVRVVPFTVCGISDSSTAEAGDSDGTASLAPGLVSDEGFDDPDGAPPRPTESATIAATTITTRRARAPTVRPSTVDAGAGRWDLAGIGQGYAGMLRIPW